MNNLNRIFFLFATLVFSLVISGAVAAEDTEAPEVEIYPSGGTYYEPIYVYFEDLNQENNVIVYYTLDESEPTTNSPYINIQTDGPIFINSPGETTIKFMASDEAGNLADIKSETYFLVDEYPPVYNSGNGEYYYNHPVSKELYAWDNFDDNPKAYYTINGEDPTTSSTFYTGPINIPEGQTILKFFFMDDSGNSSEIFTEIYNIDSIAPTATANPIGGTYNNLNTIELTASDNTDLNPEIYYTTNGDDPFVIDEETGDIYGNYYIGPITIESAGQFILKFIAKDSFGNFSPIYTEMYNIVDNISPIANATPTGGTYYNDPVNVDIQVNDNFTGSIIYYTTDGADPNVNSEIFYGLRLLEGITTLKYLVVDASGNQSPVYTENYNLIDNQAPVVTANPTSCAFDIYYDWFNLDPNEDFICDSSVNLSAIDMDQNPVIYYTID
ncbi:MAG: chitobiase/beta-hexosaminidase C-terminal domain-containing protein, partial [Methanobacterium sp.]|nr:chitobiase/beta-hexosaminidase C-terminal domain-containing protein [Methanobacterium sp.]